MVRCIIKKKRSKSHDTDRTPGKCRAVKSGRTFGRGYGGAGEVEEDGEGEGAQDVT